MILIAPLGPDGFPGKFYQVFWDDIAPDLHAAVQEFFIGVPVPKSISSALIVLLPKKSNPSTFGDFRPICLCNFINKLFTRIICDRLQEFLPKLISPEQSAFLKGRDISDNILLAQELLQHLDKKVRGSNVVFKLDIMKAFDRVSWTFLRQLLLKFGFPIRFVDIILGNLQASWFSILFNGSPSGFFQASRGLKQGDPLSLFYSFWWWRHSSVDFMFKFNGELSLPTPPLEHPQCFRCFALLMT